MRTIYTLAFLFCTSLFVQAQIQRGDHIITLEPRTGLFNADDFGGLRYDFLYDNTGFYLSPIYGYALTDRLVVGGSLNVESSVFNSERDWRIGLNPYLRYYAINRDKLGLYGQVSTGAGLNDNEFYGFQSANLRAGLQVPLASGVRFGPVLDYRIGSGRNLLTLGGQIEIVLHNDGGAKTAPISAFRVGSVMLGGQLAELGVRKNIIFGGFSLGGHYFLLDRIAAGLSVGASGSRLDNSTASQDFTYTSHQLSADLSARYYFTTGKRLVWYAEAGGGYYWYQQRSESPLNSPDEERNTFSLSAALGGQYFVREHIALEFGPQWRQVLNDELNGGSVGLTTGVRFFLR